MRPVPRLPGVLTLGMALAIPVGPVVDTVDRIAGDVESTVGEVGDVTGDLVRPPTAPTPPPSSAAPDRVDAAPSAPAASTSSVSPTGRTRVGEATEATRALDGPGTRRDGGRLAEASSPATATPGTVAVGRATGRAVPSPRGNDRPPDDPAPRLTGAVAEVARPTVGPGEDGLIGDARRFALPLLVALGVIGYLALSRGRGEEDRLRPDPLSTGRALEFG